MLHCPNKIGQLLLVAILFIIGGCAEDHAARKDRVIANPTLIRVAAGSDGISALLFCSANNQMIVASQDGAIERWSVANPNEAVKKYRASGKAIWALALSPDGSILYCGSDDGEILSYNVQTADEGLRFVGHAESVDSIAISQDGKMLLSGSRDKTVRLWDAVTGKETWRSVQNGPIRCVGFVAGKDTVFVGSSDGVGYELDIAGGKVRSSYKYPSAVIMFSPESLTVACTRREVAFKPKSVNDFSIVGFYLGKDHVFRLSGNSDVVTSVVCSADGRRLVSGSMDKSLRLWNTAEQEQVMSYRADFPILSVAYSSDGRLMACGTTDGTVHVVPLP